MAIPPTNRNLLDRIISDHVAVSQFPLGTPPKRKNFPLRNRLTALLTDATIIVDAGVSSGTRHQGWEGLRLGRPVLLDRHFAESGVVWAQQMRATGAIVVEPPDLERIMFEFSERRAAR